MTHNTNSTRPARDKLRNQHKKKTGLSQRSANRRNAARRRNAKNNDIFNIPQITNLPILNRCMRYEGQIASSLYFNFTNLFLTMGSVRNTSTSYVSLIQSLRLLRVGITCLPSSATNAGFLTFEWGGDGTPHQQEVMVFAPGVPARGNFYPPQNSRATWWVEDSDSTSTGDVAFTVDPGDSTVTVILDLEFSFILASGTSAITHTLSTAATFDGVAYLVLPTQTDELTPVGVRSVQ